MVWTNEEVPVKCSVINLMFWLLQICVLTFKWFGRFLRLTWYIVHCTLHIVYVKVHNQQRVQLIWIKIHPNKESGWSGTLNNSIRLFGSSAYLKSYITIIMITQVTRTPTIMPLLLLVQIVIEWKQTQIDSFHVLKILFVLKWTCVIFQIWNKTIVSNWTWPFRYAYLCIVHWLCWRLL